MPGCCKACERGTQRAAIVYMGDGGGGGGKGCYCRVCFVHPAVSIKIIGLGCSQVKPKANTLVLYYYQYVSRTATRGVIPI